MVLEPILISLTQLELNPFWRQGGIVVNVMGIHEINPKFRNIII